MSSSSAVITAVASAPGKVLLAGGFLVLDRKHRGLVFGLDARIHVAVVPRLSSEAPSPEGQKGGSEKGEKVVRVRSPQFKGAEWVYAVKDETRSGEGVEVRQLENADGQTSTNPFVQTTLLYVLTFLEHIPSTTYDELSITILADNDYYSNPGSIDRTEATHGTQFKFFGVPLTSAHKTGLGSSAALVTALTASLLAALARNFKISENQARVHNLAQAAHCAAQGKVGSGFDVAAAVYGSCLYRRFSPSILERLGEAGREGFGERLHQCVEDLSPEAKWDVEIQKDAVKVPQSLRLVMCDVDCGSQTPGMVKKVLAWRKENSAEADVLWSAIQQGTEDLCLQMRTLSLNDASPTVLVDYHGLRDTIETIRSFVREMSDKSQVPIEPRVQTELLDACSAVSGVVGGVVPGAGGYDAIALLVKNDDAVIGELQSMLQNWQSSVKEEDPAAKIGKVRLLDVKQEFEGVRQEEASQYPSWL